MIRPLADWDRRSIVRGGRPRDAGQPGQDGGAYFRPDLVRHANLPEVAARGPDVVRALRLRHLNRYLWSTETVETAIVNPALLLIAQRQIPREIALAAYKIQVDEAYHALMAAELRLDLLARAGLTSAETLPMATPQRRVLALIRGLDEPLREPALIAAAGIQETLITANLRQANDPVLRADIRAMIADHARDEARHHAFFIGFFGYFWRRLDAGTRMGLQPLLPRLVRLLLSPDPSAAEDDLVAEGFAPASARRLALEAYAGLAAPAATAGDADGTLEMFRRAGLFDTPEFAKQYAAGLSSAAE